MSRPTQITSPATADRDPRDSLHQPQQRSRGRRLSSGNWFAPPASVVVVVATAARGVADALLAIPVVVALVVWIENGRRRMRDEPDAGYSTETVLVTALLVILALTVLAIISAKIIEKANGITLD